jgi:diguanylate cyclase (GGDEF)-like protein
MSWASTFSTESLERQYQAELGAEKVRLTRIMALLGAALTLSFMVLDLWAIPSAVLAVWAIRGAIVAGLALMFMSTSLSAFQTIYPWVILGSCLVMGAGVNAMIYLAQASEVAVDAYHGGLLLIIIGVYTLTYVNLYLSSAIALGLTSSYAAIAVLRHDYHTGTELVVLIAHLYLGVSTTVIGIVAQTLRDRYARENYLLRHSLQRDVEIKEEEKRHASYLAEHDPLTGVANRLRFDKDANAMLRRASELGWAMQMLFLDLDSFKPVNDEHGHAVGDRVLKIVAERLRQSVRPDDVVARVGGDEFVVALLVPADDRTAGAIAAETIAAAVAEGIELRGRTLQLSVSIGVAAYPADGEDLAAVMRAADEQMYLAKNRGKSGIAMTPGCQPARLAG